MKRSYYYISIIVAFFLSAVLLWVLSVDRVPRYVDSPATITAKNKIDWQPGELQTARMRLFHEDSELLKSIQLGGGFGGKYSLEVATDIFGSSEVAIEDVRAKTEVVSVTEGVWLIRFPIVNVVLVETQVGLVLIDTAYSSASEVLFEKIRELSDKPLHTVIYTHGHVDHAYGLKALLREGERPEIIAHKNLPARFERYIKMRGSIAKYMGQPVSSLPASKQDLVYPTRLFEERLQLLIGGEPFVIAHHPAETDDQLYVWMPNKGVLASADYYQGFLPNAGNGKRIQRYIEEWAIAMREMAALGAKHLAPAHGVAMIDSPEKIQREFLLLAETFDIIVKQTLEGLNKGMRKDLIVESISLPLSLRNKQSLREQYVSVQDIAKMLILRHTGWWDDIPSHWSPANLESQAKEIAVLAGGAKILAKRARALIKKDIRMACHLADWAWMADPEDAEVQAAVFDVYRARVLDPDSNTMEIVNYVSIMAEARALQLRNEARN